MKIRTLTLTLLLAAFSAVLFPSCKKEEPSHPPTTDSTVNLKNGLLVYLPFTGNFADSSGNNNPTTGVDGVTLTTDYAGRTSSAMDGTAHGESVVVTNNGSIKFDTAYTVSLNFMLKSYGSQTFVSFVDPVTANGPSFNIGIGTTQIGGQYLDLGIGDATAGCDNGGANDPNRLLSTSATTPLLNVWNNAIYVYRRGTIQIYVNGTLVSTKKGTGSTALLCPSSKFIVGAWWNGDKQSINGKLDEVRLYNRALNAWEIAKLAQGFPVQAPPPAADLKRGLLLYLPFNGSIADSSGNNNPTVAVNGATLTADEHGYANSAFGSNGGGQTIQVTNNGSIKFDTALSISLSFMSRDNNSLHCYLSMTNYVTGHGPTFELGTTVPGYPNFDFGIVDRAYGCDTWGYGPNDVNDTTSFIPQPERWYNAVCIYHKGSIQTYINGQLVSSKPGNGTGLLLCPDAKIVVGGWWSQDIENVNGVIDNVRMYNRVLMPEEIAMLATHYQPSSNSVHPVVTH